MKVSAYKMLITENKRNAMIFDLTERFPRGPKAKLRAKHYNKHDRWGGNALAPESDELIGGDRGTYKGDMHRNVRHGTGVYKFPNRFFRNQYHS